MEPVQMEDKNYKTLLKVHDVQVQQMSTQIFDL
jgi:hypothetical protein